MAVLNNMEEMLRDGLPGNTSYGFNAGRVALSALPIMAIGKGLHGAGTGGLEGGIKGLAQGVAQGGGTAAGGLLGAALGQSLSDGLPGGVLNRELAKAIGLGVGGLAGNYLAGKPFKNTNKIKQLSDKQKLEKLEANEAKSKAKKEEAAPVEKEARNLGLSSVQDISEGGRGAMMEHALKLLMQARAMARPTDEDLGNYGTDRDNFEAALGRISGANAGAEPGDKLDVTSIKASPKKRGLGYGLAAGIPSALLGYQAGGLGGALAGGLLAGGGAGLYGAASAGKENEHNLAAARALRDYGVLSPGALTKVMPLLSDKTAAEKCECCGKSPCECPENCSCGCKQKMAEKQSGLFYKDLDVPAFSEVNVNDKPGLAAVRTKEPRLLTRLFSNPNSDFMNAINHVIESKGGNYSVSEDPSEHLSNDLNIALKKLYPSRYRDPSQEEVGSFLLRSLGDYPEPKNRKEFEDLMKTHEAVPAQKYLSPEDKMTIQSLISGLGSTFPEETVDKLKKAAASKPGLWANIHAKKQRGEAPAKPGDKDYPTAKNWKKVTDESEKKASPAWQTSEGKNPEGGLNEKGRRSLKAQGHDIKRPQPEGGPRKDSFCARMKGMKSKLTSSETANDPDSRINKALRKWKCGSAAEKLASLLKTSKCWEGYERVPGTKPLTPGSCRPVGGKKKEDKSEKSK